MPSDRSIAFISYSRDDSEFALRLAWDLKSAGARVWLDQLDIQPGQRWARAVQEAMTDAPLLLVILSPSSVSSINVEDEVAFALEEHKTVIPIFFQDCKVPFRLRPFQHADFRSDYGRGLKSLLASLGVKSTAPGKSASSPEPNAVQEIDLEDHEEESIAAVPEPAPARAMKAAARKAPAKKTTAVKKPAKRSAVGRSAAKTTKRGKDTAAKKFAKKTPAKKPAVKKAAPKKATT
ncbi:toll/interleukin-1 receptor domain-containing protein [Acidicapsa acidisoli]|uniref:toll/interleukin-1 receptor domain-containing protein n=1 Tax=Acidicapsa acidisoli TaxID=1615681 RepID=UPI0021E0AE93|nr:toll/interleukin-1 receptor domain-containing protein [Acidicapsa acidisoli]